LTPGGAAVERLFIYRKDASDPDRKDDIIGWGSEPVVSAAIVELSPGISSQPF